MRQATLNAVCFVVGLVSVVAGWLALVFALVAAPAPAPKPVPPAKIEAGLDWADLIGEWEYTWSGERCPCFLYLDGLSVATYRGQQWVGRWRVERGVLIVEDALAGGENSATWTVRLVRAVGGDTGGRRWTGFQHGGGTAPEDFTLRR